MRQFIMISMFLLSLLIVINVIGWLWPVLTHPIAVIIYICFFVLFAKSAYEASQK